jgi:hypothetical protein
MSLLLAALELVAEVDLCAVHAMRLASTCKALRVSVGGAVESRPELLSKRVAVPLAAELRAYFLRAHGLETVLTARAFPVCKVFSWVEGVFAHELLVECVDGPAPTLARIEFHTDDAPRRGVVELDLRVVAGEGAFHPSLTVKPTMILLRPETATAGVVVSTTAKKSLPRYDAGPFALLVASDLLL